MYKAEILADSLSPQGNRLTTMKITFPRIILAEFNTHRMFSRNSASSRAIPFKKMVQMVQENPFIPIAWQKDHKGMQGSEYFTDTEMPNIIEPNWFTNRWLEARNKAVEQALILNNAGVTKQLCNRLLEPFMWHTVIVSATEWENFFNLRCPQYTFEGDSFKLVYKSKKDAMKDGWEANDEHPEGGSTIDWLKINHSQADIHIQAIAELMWDAMNESTPKQLQAGEWHISFGDVFHWDKILRSNIDETDRDLLIKVATARCARLTYETLGDNPKIDYEADIKLHDRLLIEKHWSPFEHNARAMSNQEYEEFYTCNDGTGDGWCRNFRGFIQYRHLIEKHN